MRLRIFILLAAGAAAASLCPAAPLGLELSRAATEPSPQFTYRGSQYWLSLSRTEVALSLFTTEQADPDRIRMRIVGADAQAPRTGAGREWGAMNHYAGRDHDRWIRGVQSFDQVKYDSVYPGIDLIYYGAGRQLEYRFVVGPRADPSSIEIAFDGARQVSVSPSGELIIETRRGELRQRPPRVYQRASDGTRRPVSGAFRLTGPDRVAFTVTGYDGSRPLVIE